MRYYLSAFLFAFLILFAFAGNAEGNYACEDDLIEVMFVQDATVRLRFGALVDLSENGALDGIKEVLELTTSYQWERISTVSEEEIDEMESRGEQLTGRDIYNLNNIYVLRFQGDIDVWELAEILQELDGIISAMPVPLPQPPPQPPDFQGMQGYLKAASFTPTGIDAIYAWTQTGGDGTGVTVCDLEYSWNYNHNDLTKALGSQINTYVQDPFSNNNHGTAVLGEMVSDLNGWGTTGICYGAGLKTCGTYYGNPTPWWNVSGAIIVAISHLSAGDVILLEQQWEYVSGSYDYVPIEWWGAYSPNAQGYNVVYAAIQNAVANGIHVVEAGGNAVNGGGVNMDLMAWFGDSGAMIVGAGGAYTSGDLKRLYYSNHGSRFTSHGWGEDVVTTGYGTLYSSMGVNYYYTATFGGTSSASPMVAGAAACCVGYWVANGNPVNTLTPMMLRTTLANTGTLQIFPPSGSIGTRPNLMSAFAYLYSVGIGTAEESSGSVAMSVFPNPASEYLTIELFRSSDMISLHDLVIYDITGRQVASLGISDIMAGESVFWDCRDMSGIKVPGGLYTAAGVYDSGSVTVPFIILNR
ncbi:MAG: S8 family serine peptidase [Candidatus Aegiribacteria sp.]|nr:S8 family serine peptidase [Candidatus Aegiribacteria sp.]